MTPEQRLARIDEIFAEIKAMFPRPSWQPKEKHPVGVIHERKAYEQRLRSMATQVRIGGGQVRPEFE
jgi:hypothetical protein